MELMESYVYKKEVDLSLLTEGLTLPIDNQVVFGKNMGKFLARGESKVIKLYLDGKTYEAKITNLNFNALKYKRKDILQIRYKKNGELANVLKELFAKSANCILAEKQLREPGDRTRIHLPEEYKEYLAIYTTKYEDSYLLEPIVIDDVAALKNVAKLKTERFIETGFNYDVTDENAAVFETLGVKKIRKLNRAIGENLKLLYDYRCQICGKNIGSDYNAHVVEAHHINYFTTSFNNDSNNQLIVCPNHHSIIHDVNPVFDRKSLLYLYPNGIKEGLILNRHL